MGDGGGQGVGWWGRGGRSQGVGWWGSRGGRGLGWGSRGGMVGLLPNPHSHYPYTPITVIP